MPDKATIRRIQKLEREPSVIAITYTSPADELPYYGRLPGEDRSAVHLAALAMLTVRVPTDETSEDFPDSLRIKLPHTTIYAVSGPRGKTAIEYSNGSELVKSLPRIARRIIGLPRESANPRPPKPLDPDSEPRVVGRD